MAVVVGAFVATVYYMTHDVGTDMDSAMPALSLITAIGTGLLGVVWTICRRYWHTLILLIALGVLRGLFAFPRLLTQWQTDYLWVSIGVIGLGLVVTLTARTLVNERALKAAKGTGTIQIPAQTITAVGPVSAPASASVSAQDTAVMETASVAVSEQDATTLESTVER